MRRDYMCRIFAISLLLIFVATGTCLSEEFVIGPEDMLQITVWGSPELNAHIPVRPDGRISLPLLGDILVDGMTPMALKANLEKDYQKYVKSPNVSVIVTAINSLKVFVSGGGVQTSGAVALKRSTSLFQLLSQFGSMQGADLKNAYLQRDGRKMPVNFQKLVFEGDGTQDIILKRGDIIFIPPDVENKIKVVGAVKNPGLFPFVKGMTALDAVLGAGGFTEFASQNSVEVVRQEGSEIKRMEVRLKDVIRDGDMHKNLPLKPGDMVSVKTGLF